MAHQFTSDFSSRNPPASRKPKLPELEVPAQSKCYQFSEETIQSLQELGDVLKAIRKRLGSEGITATEELVQSTQHGKKRPSRTTNAQDNLGG